MPKLQQIIYEQLKKYRLIQICAEADLRTDYEILTSEAFILDEF